MYNPYCKHESDSVSAKVRSPRRRCGAPVLEWSLDPVGTSANASPETVSRIEIDDSARSITPTVADARS
ncbi:hypothetical protein BRC86_13470 [Halobacteriales archaeon QS_3_64_16]|nr:MAG: hypothetical protein BRC86_13470 [Halobacteriales archaeon QS_3_64_16]